MLLKNDKFYNDFSLVTSCLKLKGNLSVSGLFKKKSSAAGEDLCDGVLTACYSYISQGNGWTDFTTKLEDGKTPEVTVRPDYLPLGEEDKTDLYRGVRSVMYKIQTGRTRIMIYLCGHLVIPQVRGWRARVCVPSATVAEWRGAVRGGGRRQVSLPAPAGDSHGRHPAAGGRGRHLQSAQNSGVHTAQARLLPVHGSL